MSDFKPPSDAEEVSGWTPPSDAVESTQEQPPFGGAPSASGASAPSGSPSPLRGIRGGAGGAASAGLARPPAQPGEKPTEQAEDRIEIARKDILAQARLNQISSEMKELNEKYDSGVLGWLQTRRVEDRALELVRERDSIQTNDLQASLNALASDAVDKAGDSILESTPGTDEMRVSADAAHDVAKQVLKSMGVDDQDLYMSMVDKVKSAAVDKHLAPRTSKAVDDAVDPIRQKWTEAMNEFVGSDKAAAKFTGKVADLQAEFGKKIEAESAGISKELKDKVAVANAGWEVTQKALQREGEQLDADYKAGKLDAEQYNLEVDRLNKRGEAYYSQYQAQHERYLSEYQERVKPIALKYQSQFEQQQRILANSLNDQLKAKAKEFEELNSSAMKAEIKDAASGAVKGVYDKYAKELESAAERANLGEIWTYGGAGAAMINFAAGFRASLGNWLKGSAVSMGSDALYEWGDEMANASNLVHKPISGLADWVNPAKAGQAIGDLAGYMAPGMLASGVVATASGGVGAPAAMTLVASGLAGWASESQSMAGSAYERAILDGKSKEQAEKAAAKTWETQTVLLPAYAFEGLPFMGKALKAIGPKVGRVVAGGGIEMATETLQEIPQGIFEARIAAGLDPYAGFFETLDKQLDDGTIRDTMWALSPTLILGGGGQLNSSSARQEMERMVKAAATSAAVATEVKAAPAQWMSSVIDASSEAMARASISMMHQSGFLSDQELEAYSGMLDSVVRSRQHARDLGLSGERRDAYVALSAERDVMLAKADQLDATKGSEREPGGEFMRKAAEKLDEKISAIVTGDARKSNYIVVRHPNGRRTIMTPEQLSKASGNARFIASFVAAGKGERGVSIDAVGGEADQALTAFTEKMNAVMESQEAMAEIAKVAADGVRGARGAAQKVPTLTEASEIAARTGGEQELADRASAMGETLRKLSKDEETGSEQAVPAEGEVQPQAAGAQEAGQVEQAQEGREEVVQSEPVAESELDATGVVTSEAEVSDEQIQAEARQQSPESVGDQELVAQVAEQDFEAMAKAQEDGTDAGIRRARAVRQIGRAHKALKGLSGGFSVTLHQTNDEMVAAEKEAGIEQDLGGAGFYDPNTRTIHLNMESIGSPRSVEETTVQMHEPTHLVMDVIASEDPDAITSMYSALTSLDAEGVSDVLDFASGYRGESYKSATGKQVNVEHLEALTEFIARVATGDIDLRKKSTRTKIRELITKFARKMGIPVPKNIESQEALREFASQVAEAMRSGSEVRREWVRRKRDSAPTQGRVRRSISMAARLAAMENVSMRSEEEFWGKFWPEMMRAAGAKFRASKASDIKAAAELFVQELEGWMRSNPQYRDYYNKDRALSAAILQSIYPELQEDPDPIHLFFLLAGLTSADTALPANIMDATRGFNLFMEQRSYDAFEVEGSPRSSGVIIRKAPFTLSARTGPGKARAILAIDAMYKKLGSWQKVVEHLHEPVTVKELNEFRMEVLAGNPAAYRGKIGGIADIKRLVMEATGQDQLIPRAFNFGIKVGAYTLNNTGLYDYTTIDIWESRSIRSWFPYLFKKTQALPANVSERRLFSRFQHEFANAFEEHYGEPLDKAALQAIRWFYMIDNASTAGWSNAKSLENISTYLEQSAVRIGLISPDGEKTGGQGSRPVLRSKSTYKRDDAWAKEVLNAQSLYEGNVDFYDVFGEGRDWAILTGENPNGFPVDDATNRELNNEAYKWLVERGYNPKTVVGKYGDNYEESFIVPDITIQDSIAFAKAFIQESVATASGLVYANGKMHPIKGRARVRYYDIPDLDTSKMGAVTLFRSGVTQAGVINIGYDFDQTIDAKDTSVIEVDGKMRKRFDSEGHAIANTDEGIRNFWRWFGDSAIVDRLGRPRVMYHGTPKSGFSEFDTDGTARSPGAFFASDERTASGYTQTGTNKFAAGQMRPQDIFDDPSSVGIEFETRYSIFDEDGDQVVDEAFESAEAALEEYELSEGEAVQARLLIVDEEGFEWDGKLYTEDQLKDPESSPLWDIRMGDEIPGVFAVYLKIDNPLDIDFEGNNWDDPPSTKIYNLYNEEGEMYEQVSSKEEAEQAMGSGDATHYKVFDVPEFQDTNHVVREARMMGEQGVVMRNIIDSYTGYDGEIDMVAVALHPNQIKSINNTGEFSPYNDDIRRSVPVYRRKQDVATDVDFLGKSFVRAIAGGQSKRMAKVRALLIEAARIMARIEADGKTIRSAVEERMFKSTLDKSAWTTRKMLGIPSEMIEDHLASLYEESDKAQQEEIDSMFSGPMRSRRRYSTVQRRRLGAQELGQDTAREILGTKAWTERLQEDVVEAAEVWLETQTDAFVKGRLDPVRAEESAATMLLSGEVTQDVHTYMMGLVHDLYLDRAAASKSLSEKRDFEERAARVVNAMAERALEAGRANAILHKVYQNSPHYWARIEVQKLKRQQEESLKGEVGPNGETGTEYVKRLREAFTEALKENERLAQALEALRELNGMIDELNARRAMESGSEPAGRIDLDQLLGEKAGLEDRISELEDLVQRQQEELQALEDRIADIIDKQAERKGKMADEIAELKKQRRELKAKLERQANAIEQLKGLLQLERSERKQLEKDLKKLRQEFDRFINEILPTYKGRPVDRSTAERIIAAALQGKMGDLDFVSAMAERLGTSELTDGDIAVIELIARGVQMMQVSGNRALQRQYITKLNTLIANKRISRDTGDFLMGMVYIHALSGANTLFNATYGAALEGYTQTFVNILRRLARGEFGAVAFGIKQSFASKSSWAAAAAKALRDTNHYDDMAGYMEARSNMEVGGYEQFLRESIGAAMKKHFGGSLENLKRGKLSSSAADFAKGMWFIIGQSMKVAFMIRAIDAFATHQIGDMLKAADFFAENAKDMSGSSSIVTNPLAGLSGAAMRKIENAYRSGYTVQTATARAEKELRLLKSAGISVEDINAGGLANLLFGRTKKSTGRTAKEDLWIAQRVREIMEGGMESDFVQERNERAREFILMGGHPDGIMGWGHDKLKKIVYGKRDPDLAQFFLGATFMFTRIMANTWNKIHLNLPIVGMIPTVYGMYRRDDGSWGIGLDKFRSDPEKAYQRIASNMMVTAVMAGVMASMFDFEIDDEDDEDDQYVRFGRVKVKLDPDRLIDFSSSAYTMDYQANKDIDEGYKNFSVRFRQSPGQPWSKYYSFRLWPTMAALPAFLGRLSDDIKMYAPATESANPKAVADFKDVGVEDVAKRYMTQPILIQMESSFNSIARAVKAGQYATNEGGGVPETIMAVVSSPIQTLAQPSSVRDIMDAAAMLNGEPRTQPEKAGGSLKVAVKNQAARMWGLDRALLDERTDRWGIPIERTSKLSDWLELDPLYTLVEKRKEKYPEVALEFKYEGMSKPPENYRPSSIAIVDGGFEDVSPDQAAAISEVQKQINSERSASFNLAENKIFLDANQKEVFNDMYKAFNRTLTLKVYDQMNAMDKPMLEYTMKEIAKLSRRFTTQVMRQAVISDDYTQVEQVMNLARSRSQEMSESLRNP